MPVELCCHLQPLVELIRAASIQLVPTSSPYSDSYSWWRSECTFDEAVLRKRLGLDQCVAYYEYFGMAAGSDATWNCAIHNHVIIGPHPRMAGADTPRLS